MKTEAEIQRETIYMKKCVNRTALLALRAELYPKVSSKLDGAQLTIVATLGEKKELNGRSN